MSDGGWWREIDDEVLACLSEGPQSVTELGRRLHLSTEAVTSLLLMLAVDGKVRLDTVELARPAATPT